MSPGVDEARDLRRHEMRDAVTAARIGAPGGDARLAELLARRAERYAGFVLALPEPTAGEVARAAVARTLKGLPKGLDADDVEERLALAVRTEAFARQEGSGARGRILAVAALLVVVLGFGMFAVGLGSGGDEPSEPTPDLALSADRRDAEVVLEGRVVVDDDAVPTPDLTDVAVQVRLDDEPIATARADSSGRFRMGGLTAAVYDVRVAAPDGLRLADGFTTVDLTDPDDRAVVIRLERP